MGPSVVRSGDGDIRDSRDSTERERESGIDLRMNRIHWMIYICCGPCCFRYRDEHINDEEAEARMLECLEQKLLGR